MIIETKFTFTDSEIRAIKEVERLLKQICRSEIPDDIYHDAADILEEFSCFSPFKEILK